MKTKLLQIPMPIQLRERLEKVAKADRRSMTAEALVILEDEIRRREEIDRVRSGEAETQYTGKITEQMVEDAR